MRKLKSLLLVFFLIAFSSTEAQQLKTIKSPSASDGGSNLALWILQEIVKVQGEYKLEYPHAGMDNVTFGKVLADFEAGELDVIWTLSSKEYEDRYQAVYYPLYKGMFGMRLAIVKRERLSMLSGVDSLSDLQQFSAGQGKQWADTPILQSNGIPVVPVNKYHNHFPMLEGGRFDYFPVLFTSPGVKFNETPNTTWPLMKIY